MDCNISKSTVSTFTGPECSLWRWLNVHSLAYGDVLIELSTTCHSPLFTFRAQQSLLLTLFLLTLKTRLLPWLSTGCRPSCVLLQVCELTSWFHTSVLELFFVTVLHEGVNYVSQKIQISVGFTPSLLQVEGR